jgi:hypothetical protein
MAAHQPPTQVAYPGRVGQVVVSWRCLAALAYGWRRGQTCGQVHTLLANKGSQDKSCTYLPPPVVPATGLRRVLSVVIYYTTE